MTHASTFSGIGGFDLAATWKGWQNIFQVENDESCQKVLSKNFPEVQRFGDIRLFDGSNFAGKIDVLSGGFPCQPFSNAGKRRGVNDNRYLWPEMLRVIAEVQPAFFVGENVSGITTLENGRTIGRICADLESIGYKTECYLIPACAVEAWHIRERCYILAHAYSKRCKKDRAIETKVSYKEGFRDEWQQVEFCRTRGGNVRPIPKHRVCGVDNGLSKGVDGYQQLGNAVVPQLIYSIFDIIEHYYFNLI